MVRHTIGKQERVRNVTESQVNNSLKAKHALNSNFVRLAYTKGLAPHLAGLYSMPLRINLLKTSDLPQKDDISMNIISMLDHYKVKRIYADDIAFTILTKKDCLEIMADRKETYSWGQNIVTACRDAGLTRITTESEGKKTFVEYNLKAVIDRETNTVFFVAEDVYVGIFKHFDANSSDYIENNACPSMDKLRKFSAGNTKRSRHLEKHLELCPRCRDLVDEIRVKKGKIDIEV